MQQRLNGKIKDFKLFPKILFYALFGILWSFSQVGYSFALLPWFTFIPFIYSIKFEGYKTGFIYSLIFGTTAYIFHLWWMPNPIALAMNFSFLPGFLNFTKWIIAWIIMILISAYHGLIYSLIFLITKYISKHRYIIFYLTIPLAATVLDFFYPKLWNDQVGYSQFIFFHFSQFADVLGVPGLSFVIFSCNSATLIFLESYLLKKKWRLKLGAGIFFSVILVVIGISIYGVFRSRYIDKLIASAPKAKIGIVQGNYSGLDKRDKENIKKMIYTYNKLSFDILDQNPDLIIWPETAIPSMFSSERIDYESIMKFTDAPLLTGVHLVDKTGDKKFLYNSLILLSGKRRKIDTYSKMNPVPFVEYVPLPFDLMKKIGYLEFSAGKDKKIMEVNDIKFSPNICYEAIIPGFIRRSIKINEKRANLLINATNDSWYGKTIEPKMHLHMSGFRSIENRVSMVRSTCTGYSAVFNPNGDIIYISNLFEKSSVVKEVPLLEIETFYQKLGWLFPWILLLVIIFLFSFSFSRKIRYKIIKSKKIKRTIFKRDLSRMWFE